MWFLIESLCALGFKVWDFKVIARRYLPLIKSFLSIMEFHKPCFLKTSEEIFQWGEIASACFIFLGSWAVFRFFVCYFKTLNKTLISGSFPGKGHLSRKKKSHLLAHFLTFCMSGWNLRLLFLPSEGLLDVFQFQNLEGLSVTILLKVWKLLKHHVKYHGYYKSLFKDALTKKLCWSFNISLNIFHIISKKK